MDGGENDMANETLVNISADSMDDFMKKVADKIGEGEGVMGNTTYTITPKGSSRMAVVPPR